MIQMVFSHFMDLCIDTEYNTGDCAQEEKNSEIAQEKCEILPVIDC